MSASNSWETISAVFTSSYQRRKSLEWQGCYDCWQPLGCQPTKLKAEKIRRGFFCFCCCRWRLTSLSLSLPLSLSLSFSPSLSLPLSLSLSTPLSLFVSLSEFRSPGGNVCESVNALPFNLFLISSTLVEEDIKIHSHFSAFFSFVWLYYMATAKISVGRLFRILPLYRQS